MPRSTSPSRHPAVQRSALQQGFLMSTLVSALVLAAGAEAASTCNANFSDYKVSIFAGTNPASASQDPSTPAYPPAGYKVLSGGAIVHTLQGSAFLTGSYPDFDPGASDLPVGWNADSKHLGTGTRARVTSYVIALYDPDNCWSVKAFSQSTSTAVAHPSATATLGAGYVLVGGGAKATPKTAGGNGNFLFSSVPSVTGGAAYNGWTAQSKDQGTSDPANITVWAIGIKPAVTGVNMPTSNVLPGRASASLANPMAIAMGYNNVLPGVNCTLTGGGANDNWGNGWGNLLTASYPVGTSGWQAFGQSSGPDSAAVMTPYVICLN